MATSLASQSMFYGVTFSHPLDELITSTMVAVAVSTMPFLSKMVMKKHRPKIMDLTALEKERERMEKCRAFCRYTSGCCLCVICLDKNKPGAREQDEEDVTCFKKCARQKFAKKVER